MKKLLVFLLLFVMSAPTIWAYDLSKQDKVIVQRAVTAIEKMITRKWENYREKYVVALQKIQLRFQNNPRMHEIIGETANTLNDDTNGLENIITSADASVNTPAVTTANKNTEVQEAEKQKLQAEKEYYESKTRSEEA